jgi:hypothetical protein
MDTTVWTKLRDSPRLSWHIVGRVRFGATRCGRWIPVPSPSANDLPMGEKSCETCLRLTAWDAERDGAT